MAAACPRLSVCLSVSAWELCVALEALLGFGCASRAGGEGSLCLPGWCGATAGVRRILSTVAGQGSLWLCSQLPAGVSSGGAAWAGMDVSLPGVAPAPLPG